MTRVTFDHLLQELQDDILVLADSARQALLDSVRCLKERNIAGSQELIAADRQIDELRYRIEAQALTLIATQQPMAGDMRMLAAVLFISNELERIADYAKGIARITIRLGDDPLIKPLIDIPRMVELAAGMLQASLQAFVSRDLDLAHEIVTQDDLVDALYDQVYRELITLVLTHPRRLEQANLLLWTAHNLERAADRVTNICERVIYCVTGELIDTGWEEDETPHPVQVAGGR